MTLCLTWIQGCLTKTYCIKRWSKSDLSRVGEPMTHNNNPFVLEMLGGAISCFSTTVKISLPSHPYWSHNSKRNIQTPRPLTSPHSRTLTPVPEQWTMQPPISEHPHLE